MKNDQIIMLFVAFLLGYFARQLCSGVVEGYKCNADLTKSSEYQVQLNNSPLHGLPGMDQNSWCNRVQPGNHVPGRVNPAAAQQTCESASTNAFQLDENAPGSIYPCKWDNTPN